jgi:hypothetical protein
MNKPLTDDEWAVLGRNRIDGSKLAHFTPEQEAQLRQAVAEAAEKLIGPLEKRIAELERAAEEDADYRREQRERES